MGGDPFASRFCFFVSQNFPRQKENSQLPNKVATQNAFSLCLRTQKAVDKIS